MAVPEGNGPVPQPEEFGFDQPTLANVYRRFEERFGRQLEMVKSRLGQQEKKLNGLMEEMREAKNRLVGLEQDARQPRLAMKVDVPSDTKTRERAEGVAAAVQAKRWDSCSVNRVDPGLMCLTSFGDDSTGPPTLSCSRDNALVDNGAAAPKLCLSPLEMRTPTAAGGLLPAGIASTASRTTFE